MADNQLVITAGLNIPETVHNIQKELDEKVAPQLKLKIACNIDTSYISEIKSQISNLSKQINSSKISIPIDDKSIKNQAKALSDALDLAIPRGKTKEVRDVIQGLINDYQTAFQSNNFDEMTKSFAALESYVDNFRKDVQVINNELVEMQEQVKALARNGKTYINESDYSELKNLIGSGKDVNKLLSQAFGVGGWTKDRSKATTSWDSKVQALNDVFDKSRFDSLNEIDDGKFHDHIDGVIQLVDYLNKSFDQGSEFAKEYADEINKCFGDQLYNELNKVLGVSASLEEEFVELLNPEEVKQTAQEFENLGNEIKRTVGKLPDISVGSSTKETLESAKTVLNDYFKASDIDGEANRVKRAVEDTTGELQRFYVQVERGDKSIETLTYALNEQGDAYEYLGKTIREADNSTDFRRKGLDVQKEIQASNLDKFVSQIEKSGVATDDLNDRINQLREQINQIADTNGMNAFLDDFDIAKAKFQALTAEQRKFNAEQTAANKEMAKNNRIKTLTADMNAYAAANKRAVDSQKQMSSGRTFAEEWVRILSQMAKGAELTDQELKDLIADFRVFNKEAQANNLNGAGVFEKFANAFKLISTYVSANQIISTATRQVREAVTELKNMDDILTEISKTSERTAESLKALGESSFDVASTYGRTASDYLLGVQEMSRAGFGEKQSEDLAELSLRAQAAGDMTAEMANQYIIATNAAYDLEGNINKLNKVLDSQNYITNRNALNMENLSEATKIAASQASASGVAIDELTAAVGTMVAVTQQGGNIAGRAIKGILMNISQVKADAADIGDGGESITTESLSKYEAATKALGVSLKEVKNGVWALRDPMQVLKELSEAIKNESEDSIKIANLISSVGGKYRGNQLIALLQNWDTYEKMLAEFNSDEAVGSAAEEAAKSANNWAGSLNQVKNSWSGLVNQFINSDNAITVIQTLNSVIQSLSDSAATGSLKVLASLLTNIVKILGVITDKLGALPVLISAIYTARYAKSGKGVFGTVSDDANKANKEVTIFGKKFSDIKKNIDSADGKGLSKVSAGIKAIGVQAVWTEIKVAALNMALSLGVSLAIGALTSAISDWIHESERAAQEAEELRKRQAELREQGLKNAEAYEKEKNELNSIISQYLELASSTKEAADVKKSLSSLQDQLIDKYGKEAGGIDLVNNSLKTNIELLMQKQELDNKQFQRDNSEAIEAAKEYFGIRNYNDIVQGRTFTVGANAGEEQVLRLESYVAKDAAITEGQILVNTALEYLKEKYPEVVDDIYLSVTEGLEDEVFLSSFVDAQSLDEQKKAIDAVVEAYEYALDLKSDEFEYFKNLTDLYSKLDEYDVGYDLIKRLQEVKTEEQGRNELKKDQEVVDRYEQLLERFSQLQAKYNDSSLTVAERYGASLDLDNTVRQLREIAAEYPVVSDTIETALANVGVSFSGVSASVETAKEVWLKSLDEAQKGIIADVDNIISAMEKIASGEAIDSKSAWDIINLDDSNILSTISLNESGEYIFDLKQMVALKDQIIEKEIESREESIETAKTNVAILEKEIELNERRVNALKKSRDIMVASGINSASDERMLAELNAELAKLEPRIEEDKSSMDAFNLTIRNETLYVDELRRSYGDLSNSAGMLNAQIKALKAEIDALNSEMDARLKAQEHVIDGIIDTFKDELDVLEQRKEALNEQLETLEKQRDTIQETVDNYKTVASYVQDVIQEEIKAIEKERQAIEDAYDERIEKLRAENEEREDALEYEQKLANLNDAKNNKVLSYSSARGWTYEVDKEKLKQAENDLASFENEQQIKSLEKERDEALEGFDERIKAREKYADEWQETVDSIVEAEQEELAQQILGSEWREKIAKMDTDTLKKFKTEFNNYNTQLKGSINTEIQNLKDSIDAIGKDIDAKNKQVTAWNNYKTELQKAVTDIKGSLEDYNKYLGTVNLSESSTASDREANLQTFMSSYSELATTLNSKQKEYDAATKALNKLADAGERVMKLNLGAALGLGSGGSAQNTGGKAGASNLVSAGAFGSTSISDLIEKLMGSMSEVFKNIFHVLGFAGGGAADYTGLAMIHGSKTHSETVFTSAQSKKLLNLVDALPNFAGFKLSAPNVATKTTTNNIGGSSINIGQMTVVADNPQQFEQQMNRYIQTKLTQSKVY